MDSESANDRHRLDAIKVLDDLAGGPQAAEAGERFVISIVLNGDTEVYDKPITIGPDDAASEANVVVAIPPAKKAKKIAARKKDEGDRPL
jgi:hypothetical protein